MIMTKLDVNNKCNYKQSMLQALIETASKFNINKYYTETLYKDYFLNIHKHTHTLLVMLIVKLI